MNEKYIIIGMFMSIICLLIIVFAFTQFNQSCQCPELQTTCSCPVNPIPIVKEELSGDIVREYDYNNLYDPLEQPTRRIPRYEIYPYYMKRQIDFPTRGYPDNFTQLGIIIRDNEKQDDNKILRLFGRQEYPGSDVYEYYTLINSGNDQIKIPIHNRRRKELYTDDVIYIRELDSSYKVRLYKYTEPKYYPDIL